MPSTEKQDKAEKESRPWSQTLMIWISVKIDAMPQLTEFCNLTSADIPKFAARKVPVPNPAETYSYEHQDKETNSLLVKMRQLPSNVRTGIILWCVKDLIQLGIVLFASHLISGWFKNPAIFNWTLVILSVFTFWTVISLALGALKERKQYKKNLALVEDLVLNQDAKFWNDERLKKWAVARYKLTSAESFMLINGIEGVMVEEGPMKGRFVSTSDGKEWTLRPALEETV